MNKQQVTDQLCAFQIKKMALWLIDHPEVTPEPDSILADAKLLLDKTSREAAKGINKLYKKLPAAERAELTKQLVREVFELA